MNNCCECVWENKQKLQFLNVIFVIGLKSVKNKLNKVNIFLCKEEKSINNWSFEKILKVSSIFTVLIQVFANLWSKCLNVQKKVKILRSLLHYFEFEKTMNEKPWKYKPLKSKKLISLRFYNIIKRFTSKSIYISICFHFFSYLPSGKFSKEIHFQIKMFFKSKK